MSLPGPQLNAKLSTAYILFRFNKYLLLYDLEKAFLQLCLRTEDTRKIRILWVKNATQGDFRQIALKCLRLPFGMRFSPFFVNDFTVLHINS